MTDRVLNGNTKIYNGSLIATDRLVARSSNDGGMNGYVQKGFYWAGTTNGSAGNYWHFKTNSLKGSSTDMVHIHGYGYAYGGATIIDAHWGWHCDGGGNNLYNVTWHSNSESGGPTATNVYAATDGYVVIVLNVPNTYFTSLHFDSNLTELYPDYQLNIQQWTATASNTGAF